MFAFFVCSQGFVKNKPKKAKWLRGVNMKNKTNDFQQVSFVKPMKIKGSVNKNKNKMLLIYLNKTTIISVSAGLIEYILASTPNKKAQS